MTFQFQDTNLQDLKLIIPQVRGDERGFFLETYKEQDFVQAGIHKTRIQENHSKSSKGVLRGLHIQTQHTQAKLIRVTQGSIYDVVIDVRPQSRTYAQWQGFDISAENKHILYIPQGFLHAFLTLEDDTHFLYKCDDIYDPMHESGVLRNDPFFNINRQAYIDRYQLPSPIISAKDQQLPTWQEFSQTYTHFS